MKSILNYSVSEIQLSYVTKVKPADRPRIGSSDDAYNVLLNNWNSDLIEFVEEFKVLLMNRANRVLGIVDISKGGTHGTVVDVKLIFVSAIKANASSIILSHNHPSGNLNPSSADIAITKRLVEAGKLLEISVFDHLIVTPDGHYSFANEGLL